MSYEILQFNLGTGHAQGFVLAGRGEHEGTQCSMTATDMDNLIGRSRQIAHEQGYDVRRMLLNAPNHKDGPEVRKIVAEALDRLFMRAHAERMAAALSPTQSPVPVDIGSKEGIE